MSTTFNGAFIKVADINTVADFWNTFNSLPSCSDLHTNTVVLSSKRVVAYSIFRKGVTPEWEDKTNQVGGEWECRDSMSAESFATMFYDLALCAVNNELDDAVVGVRCVNKCNKTRIVHKIEVWNGVASKRTIGDIALQLSPYTPKHLEFAYTSHNAKQTHARDYRLSVSKTVH